jgi:hypothetical protein
MGCPCVTIQGAMMIRFVTLVIVILLMSACVFHEEFFNLSAAGAKTTKFKGGTCGDPGTMIDLSHSDKLEIHISSDGTHPESLQLFMEVIDDSSLQFTSPYVELTVPPNKEIQNLPIEIFWSTRDSRSPTSLLTPNQENHVGQFRSSIPLSGLPSAGEYLLTFPPAYLNGKLTHFPAIKAVRESNFFFAGPCLR